MKTRNSLFPVALIGVALAAACASSPQPVARLASAEAAIRAAGESGAKHVPNAALHLHYAELQRAEAQRLMKHGDHERASMQFQRAEADANLAVALAHESKAQNTAEGATEALGPSDGANNKAISNTLKRSL